MSFLVYPTIKEIPIRGLSGMGGGIYMAGRKSGGGGLSANEIVIVSLAAGAGAPSPAGTYTSGQTIQIRGRNQSLTSLYNPSEYTNNATDGYIQVGQGTQLTCRAWGGAGGSGNSSFQGYGGSGQYAAAQFTFSSPPTLYYMVGAGGGTSQPSNENGSGGWGGGGSQGLEDEPTFASGGPSIGRPGTPWGAGGDIDDEACGRGALGGGGGGLVGLFWVADDDESTASNSDVNQGSSTGQNRRLMVSAGGGGYGGYSPGMPGRGGGSGSTNTSATSTAVGASYGDGQAGLIGAGGAGFQRGGGGGAGLYGGAGGQDQYYGDHPNNPATETAGGGGYGSVTLGTSVTGVSVSSGTLAGSPAAGDGTIVNSGTTGYVGSQGKCTSNSQIAGEGGLLYIIVG